MKWGMSSWYYSGMLSGTPSRGATGFVLWRDAQWNSVSGCYGIHTVAGCSVELRVGVLRGLLETRVWGWTPLKEVCMWVNRGPLCRGIRLVFAPLYPSCVEVENSSLDLRQFWRLTSTNQLFNNKSLT